MADEKIRMINFENLEVAVDEIKSKYATKTALKDATDRIKVLENVGSQANVLEGVKVNGAALAIADKIVDVLIATGDTNGSIKVNGTDVSVAGLTALAYKTEIAYADLAAALKKTIDDKADGSALETLIGNVEGDDAKSVRAISAEEVAKIVADADTKYDTLKEIADWIMSDTTGAAKMQSDISALKTKLTLGTHEVEGEQVEYATVKAYVEAVTSSLISLTALSAETTGTGNAITGASYDNATGKTTYTKGKTFTEAVTPAAAGNIAGLTATGQLQDTGSKVSDFIRHDEIQAVTAAEIRALFNESSD